MRKIPAIQFIWHEFYAWYPVFPQDDEGIFWLERVWRRRNGSTHVWEYRTFAGVSTSKNRSADQFL
jgi:hypothetical protein